MNRTEKATKREIGRYFIRRYLMPLKHLFALMFAFQLVFATFDAVYFAINGYVIDNFIPMGGEADYISLAIFYFAVVLTISVFCRITITLGTVIAQEIMYRIREDAFDHLQKLSFSYYDQNSVGDLLARITTDAKTYAQIIGSHLPRVLYLGSFVLGVVFYMLYLNWKIALIIFTAIPFSVFLAVVFQKRILAVSRHVMACNSKLTAAYNEGIMGVQTIRSLAKEEEFIQKFDKIADETFVYSKRSLMYVATYLPFIIASTGFGSGLLLWFGGEDVLVGVMSIGTLIVMNIYSRFLSEQILFLARTIGEMQPAQASKERLYQLLKTTVAIKDSLEIEEKVKNDYQSPELAIDGGVNKISELEFKNIDFYYKEEEPVLTNFNLKVLPGQTIALVGETGAGKSTIVSLLCRFYEPTAGEILLNGVDYRQRSLEWLQSNLGIVLQTPFLFSGTIRENIRYGDPEASDEKVMEASKVVNAHDFIIHLEKGYDTEVGEGGGQLSSGQKQLISFARAILANPQVLVMDEATSSVDPETEHLIHEGLQKVLKNRTSFIIAHRLSTIRRADRILFINQGIIEEQGSHEELMSLGEKYRELYEKQFMHYKEQEILGRSVGFN